MAKKIFWVLSKDNTAPFILVSLIYSFILSLPFLYFLFLKGQPHTSRSVGLYEYEVEKKKAPVLADSTNPDAFIDTAGTGEAQVNKFDDYGESSSTVSVVTKNVLDWKKDADSRGFILLTRLAIFSIIICFGALGAAISLISRTRNSEVPLSNITILEILSVQTIGAIFACVLGLTFMGNMLGGTLFPNPEVFYRILYVPSAFAKLVVWSFIAGFFERFVPNVLNNLAKKGEDNVQKEAREV